MSNLFSYLQKKAAELRFRLQLTRLQTGKDSEYRRYLSKQFKRSVSKYQENLKRDHQLLRCLSETANLDKKWAVLCIGPRHADEIVLLNKLGFTDVRGIDLYSDSPSILVMDMHEMTFPDNSFGLIYSRHSLEHAYDIQKVVREIIRVARSGAVIAIELPIRYETRGADLVDIGSVANLLAMFEGNIQQVLLSEEQEIGSPENEMRTPIARAIFLLTK